LQNADFLLGFHAISYVYMKIEIKTIQWMSDCCLTPNDKCAIFSAQVKTFTMDWQRDKNKISPQNVGGIICIFVANQGA
jgi:hypothetical protein